MAKTAENSAANPAYDQPLEPDKLVSMARFKRGFRGGYRFWMFKHVLAVPVAAGISLVAPEARESAIQFISQTPPEHIALGLGAFAAADALIGTSNGLIAGTVDAVRPLSQQFEQVLSFDGFRSMRAACQDIRNVDYAGMASKTVDTTANFLRGSARFITEAVRVGHAVARPTLPDSLLDNKKVTVGVSTGLGAAFGTAGYIASNFVLTADRLLGVVHENDQLWEAMAQDPVSTIGGAALTGLALSSYAMIAGRRSRGTQS